MATVEKAMVDFGPVNQTDEMSWVEKRHPAPDHSCPVEMSVTSVLQSPERNDDDAFVTTPHLNPPEKYASVACTYHGKQHAYPADRNPDTGETMAFQCD